MKALSIRQPWAWCILYAGKTIENRCWRPEHPLMLQAWNILKKRGYTEILIHASKGMTLAEYVDCLDLCHAISRKEPFPSGLTLPKPEDLPRGGIVGRATLTGIVNASESLWFAGPVGLVLHKAKPCKFIPRRGQLGFFEVPDELVQEALAA